MPHTNVKSEWVDGDLVFRDKDGYVKQFLAGAVGAQSGTPQTIRKRVTIAEVNAGVTILPAIAGFGYRMVDAYIVAIGGNVATATGIDLTATLSTARKLVAFKTAGMTQSTMLRAGTATNGVLLADGASFTKNDNNTAVTLIKDGSDVATATHLDISVTFVIE